MSKSLKSVSLYRYDVLENGLVEQLEDWSEFIQTKTEYTSDGQLLKETTYGHYGEANQLIEYFYDENNLLKEERFFHGEEEATECIKYIRNNNNLIIRELHQFLDGSEDITEYTYNSDSKLISKIQSDSDGDIESKEFFEYAGDHLISESTEDSFGNLVMKNTYSYNDTGILLESEQYINEDDKIERTVNQFDENGNKLKSLKYNSQDKLIEISRFIFKDDILQEIEDETQKGNFFVKFYYDDKGNISTQEEINDRGEIISTIERTFDEENHLLEATVYVDGMNYRPNQHYIIRYEYEFFE